jgi:hypothetical protein
MRFLVDRVALVQVLLRVLLFSSVNIIQPLLHTHIHLRVALSTTNGEVRESSKQQFSSEVGEHSIEMHTFFLSGFRCLNAMLHLPTKLL